MRSVLITGGCGFVGSALALHLRAAFPGMHIDCMDNFYRRGSEWNRPRLESHGIGVVPGDVRRAEDFPDRPYDLLIECSAEPSVLAGVSGAVDYLFETNLVGLYRCLEQCRRHGTAMLFLSTSRVYPIARLEAHPVRETDTRYEWLDGDQGITSAGVAETIAMDGARSLYGCTKLAGEQLIAEYRSAFGLRAAINRCGVIAGPGQFGKTDQGVVSLWAQGHCLGQPLKYIGYGGQGKQVRDLLHVADLCELVDLQVRNFEAWDGWCGNVSGGRAKSVSLQELTELCVQASGRSTSIGADPVTRPNDLRVYLGDCARLYARTPWRPRRDVATVVADTVRWVHDHAEDLRRIAAG